jgi:hypothetical protein
MRNLLPPGKPRSAHRGERLAGSCLAHGTGGAQRAKPVVLAAKEMESLMTIRKKFNQRKSIFG